MTTTLGFKDLIDLPEWRPLSLDPTTTAAGHPIMFDLRNNAHRDPYIYHWNATTTLNRYHALNDEWDTVPAFTAPGGSIAAGAMAVFVPSQGPAGTCASPNAAYITLATLPFSAQVGVNQLADRGDGIGYYIRVKDNGAGGTGKTEIRRIIANTSGATPVVYFDSPLSFTPVANSTYELLSGRIELLGAGTTAAGFHKSWEVATKTISGNLNVTNLAATIGTDVAFVMLDEAYVPYNRTPGEGFLVGAGTYNGGTLGCLTATASAATTLTGQASAGDAGVLANEYRNFQIRIVEDGSAPTAVGQRRVITSHTAGASPVYTVAAWTVQPSANAKFVIELNNDLLVWTNAASVTYSYRAGGFAADANWSTAAASGGAVQYANPGTAMGTGCIAESAFSIAPTTLADGTRTARHSHIYRFRGAGTVTLELFDIAAGANGVWSTLTYYGATNTTITTGACSAHDPHTGEGKYFYINVNGTQRFMRFNMVTRTLEPWTFLRFVGSTAILGAKMAVIPFVDGTTKLSFLYHLLNTSQVFVNMALQR